MNQRVKQLTFCALCIALGVVTSYIKFASLPFGGSITLFSMLFVALPGYLFGVRAGIVTGAAYGILQFLIEPYVAAPIQILLDYPLAFGALGLSGLFRTKKIWADGRLSAGSFWKICVSRNFRLCIFCRLCTRGDEPACLHAGVQSHLSGAGSSSDRYRDFDSCGPQSTAICSSISASLIIVTRPLSNCSVTHSYNFAASGSFFVYFFSPRREYE